MEDLLEAMEAARKAAQMFEAAKAEFWERDSAWESMDLARDRMKARMMEMEAAVKQYCLEA